MGYNSQRGVVPDHDGEFVARTLRTIKQAKERWGNWTTRKDYGLHKGLRWGDDTTVLRVVLCHTPIHKGMGMTEKELRSVVQMSLRYCASADYYYTFEKE